MFRNVSHTYQKEHGVQDKRKERVPKLIEAFPEEGYGTVNHQRSRHEHSAVQTPDGGRRDEPGKGRESEQDSQNAKKTAPDQRRGGSSRVHRDRSTRDQALTAIQEQPVAAALAVIVDIDRLFWRPAVELKIVRDNPSALLELFLQERADLVIGIG